MPRGGWRFSIKYYSTLTITVVQFGQGFKDMSPPTKVLMKLSADKRISIRRHQVLSWMMDNIHLRTDSAGNIKPNKAKSSEKIGYCGYDHSP